MTPEERRKQRVKELIQQGCSLEDALDKACKEIEEKGEEAKRLQNEKHKTEWSTKFGKSG